MLPTVRVGPRGVDRAGSSPDRSEPVRALGGLRSRVPRRLDLHRRLVLLDLVGARLHPARRGAARVYLGLYLALWGLGVSWLCRRTTLSLVVVAPALWVALDTCARSRSSACRRCCSAHPVSEPRDVPDRGLHGRLDSRPDRSRRRGDRRMDAARGSAPDVRTARVGAGSTALARWRPPGYSSPRPCCMASAPTSRARAPSRSPPLSCRRTSPEIASGIRRRVEHRRAAGSDPRGRREAPQLIVWPNSRARRCPAPPPAASAGRQRRGRRNAPAGGQLRVRQVHRSAVLDRNATACTSSPPATSWASRRSSWSRSGSSSLSRE